MSSLYFPSQLRLVSSTYQLLWRKLNAASDKQGL